MATVGQLAQTDSMTEGDYRYPPWITKSDAEDVDATFNPYNPLFTLVTSDPREIEFPSSLQTQ